MNNLTSVVAVVFLVAFFTLSLRTMNQASHTKAGIEFGPAGDRKAIKMASMMMGGMPRASGRDARVPLRRALAAKEAPTVVRHRTSNSGVAKIAAKAAEPNAFPKDLKAEWRANIPKVPHISGMEVPEVPNILDEPETRSDLPR